MSELVEPDARRLPMIVPGSTNAKEQFSTADQAGNKFGIVIGGFRPHASLILGAAHGAGIVGGQCELAREQ